MKKILYSKSNFLRKPCYRIQTSVLEEDGKRVVIKTPIDDNAKNHISTIKDNYYLAKELYESNSVLKYDECKEKEISFQYIIGNDLEKDIDFSSDSLSEIVLKVEKILNIILDYKSELIKPFFKTDDFEKLFGVQDYEALDGLKSTLIANVDGILSNYIQSPNGIVMFDYEWVFRVLIPIDFLKFRNIRLLYFQYESIIGQRFKYDEFITAFGFKEEYVEIYTNMELSFQEFVHGESMAYNYIGRYIKPKISLEEKLSQFEEYKQEIISQADNYEKRIISLTKEYEQEILARGKAIDDFKLRIRKNESEIVLLRQEINNLNEKIHKIKQAIKHPFYGMKLTLKYIYRKLLKRFLNKNNQFIFNEDGICYTNLLPVINYSIENKPYISEKVSVVIPTYQGASDLMRLINGLSRQICIASPEIIVVDSGSTDDTVEVARWFGCKIIQIDQKDFSHSYARNLGASHATGDYLLFMTQDALPTDSMWLYRLVSVVKDHDIVAVSPCENTNGKGDLFYRCSCWSHQRFVGTHLGDKICRMPLNKDYGHLRPNSQLIDISCLIRKDIFDQILYKGDFAEDIYLGLRILEKGFKLAQVSSTQVFHAHNRAPDYCLKRVFVDVKTLSILFEDYPSTKISLADIKETFVSLYITTHVYLAHIESFTRWFSTGELVDQLIGMLDKPSEIDICLHEDSSLIKKIIKELDIVIDSERISQINANLNQEIKSYVQDVLVPYIIEHFEEAYADDFMNELKKAVYCRFVSIVGTILAENEADNDLLKAVTKSFMSNV